ADLRASITTFLRARGYISQDDLRTMESSAAGNLNSSLPSGQRSLSTPGDLNSAKAAVAAGMGVGPSRLDQDDFSAISTPSMSSAANRPGSGQRRRHEDVNASTDMPKVLRQPAPYNLQSMRDLYTQIPQPVAALKRFGSEVFINRDTSAIGRGTSARDTPLDVPMGPD